MQIKGGGGGGGGGGSGGGLPPLKPTSWGGRELTYVNARSSSPCSYTVPCMRVPSLYRLLPAVAAAAATFPTPFEGVRLVTLPPTSLTSGPRLLCALVIIPPTRACVWVRAPPAAACKILPPPLVETDCTQCALEIIGIGLDAYEFSPPPI